MDIKKSCRLCLNKVKGGINLFKKQAKKLGLLMKIKKYLSLNIIFNDQLPKRICNDCLMKINEFHSFATGVSKNQDKMIGIRSIFPAPDGSEILKTADTETSLLLRYLTQTQNNNNTSSSSSSSSSEDNEESEETETEIDNNRIDPMSILQCCLEETDESTINEINNEINKNFEEMSDDDDDDVENTSTVVTYLCSINNNNDKNANEFLLFNNNENIAENNSNKCPICAKAILTQTALRVHLETHRPKGEYVCDICGRVFKTQFNLCRHQNHHKIVQFPCEVCGRVYEARSTLKAHSITHSDLRPHKCPLCVKTFKRNQDLKFHINQHTGARPYECPYCPKAFASSGNCFSHRKRMHPVEVEKDKQRASKMMK